MMRYEISDYEWGVIRPMLPNKPRGIPRVDDRRILNGIFWGLEGAGRWALAWSKRAHQKSATANHSERVQHVARTLLHRYVVVFLRIHEREAAWLPKWRE